MAEKEESLPELPSWLQELLPEHATPQLLAVTDEGKLELIQPDGSTELFGGLEEAYEASRLRKLDMNIAPEVYERFGDGGFLLSFPNSDRTSTLVMSSSDRQRELRLREGYADFLWIAKHYAAAPDNFVKAWRFIDSHPAFWVAPTLERHPFSWLQEGHANKLRMGVYLNEGEVEVALDTGAHVEPEYNSHYGDWRLEVEAPTYEEAVVALAARVAITHNLDGTDNPLADAIFEKPNWVKELEERLSEYGDEPED